MKPALNIKACRLILIFFTLLLLGAEAFSQALSGPSDPEYIASLSADFSQRDQLPQTPYPKNVWESCCGPWGPWPAEFPVVKAPAKYPAIPWKRDRIIEVAKKYIGLPYQHHHIPEQGGLDCSNFTSWVYNYGLGIKLISNIQKQSESAGRQLSASEPLQSGDLLYVYSEDRTRVAHVVLYLDETHIIDSTGPGVKIRIFRGWYKQRWAWSRRILE